ncbi:Biotin--(acetyl-CoA-carboxylase) ligase [uncultured Desulfobacterium sp.]|uniref:Biotin--(Acetyl-CoA-carboxylase) ligase n=1 Tax=uncultured Desulfobacterium sp. TaxID=201089 RepID=A0A445MVM1_9BACT|nr:Biotin--(acetyl-CoA-carboxylase) ligase [uncultured Desulfobacterium sp.]
MRKPKELERQPLQTDYISSKLGASPFAGNLLWYDTIGSTNAITKSLAANGAPDNTVVVAEQQSQGRGRMGRSWLSEGNVNLLLSVLIRPQVPAEDAFSLTMAFALAVSYAAEAVCDLRVMIKWPNDLYLEGKKLGGILTEFSVSGPFVDYMILGLGLNVNWRPADDVPVLYETTSLLEASGRYVDREWLLIELLKRFDSFYQDGKLSDLNEVYEAWNRRSMLFNNKVEIEMAGERVKGKAIRIDRKGALIVLDDRGVEHRVLNGDVSVINHA